MKYLRLLFCLSFVCLAGCGATVSSPLTGLLYTEVQGPVAATGHTINEDYASGSATATSILGLIATGDASIDTAARNGGITKIYYVDYESTSTLGLVATYTVTVYGERGRQPVIQQNKQGQTYHQRPHPADPDPDNRR